MLMWRWSQGSQEKQEKPQGTGTFQVSACITFSNVTFKSKPDTCPGTDLRDGKIDFKSISLSLSLSLSIYLFLERGIGREKNINVWLPLVSCAPPTRGGGTWPATQACALTGTQTSDPLVPRPTTLNPLSFTSQDRLQIS